MPPVPAICLVHLVRAANGVEPFRAFLAAYRGVAAGVEHELVLLFKGFDSPADTAPYRELGDGLVGRTVSVDDSGFDLSAYRAAAERLDCERLCFLNSFSRPLVDDWLALLDAALSRPGVGMVGATGSWASTRSWRAHVLRLPNAYRGVLPAPPVAMRQFMAIEADRRGDASEPPASRGRTRARLQTLIDAPRSAIAYERFPSYHLRTNAFLIRRSTLVGLRWRAGAGKRDAYLLENGRHSITRQLQRRGKRTLVVDNTGAVYDRDAWPSSRTFWQGEQEGLLVEDNQTRTYAEADHDRRRLLSAFAWGAEADPDLR